jgi:mannitol 2-dehydrogenase
MGLKNPEFPTTVFGFIAEGLRLRKSKGNGSITILSCDNLQHNGNTAQNAFSSFIEAQDKDLAEWVQQNVTFPNSMVDRITPVTTIEDVKRLNEKSGIADKAPVYCEDFTQWVIEDNFIAGRPAWERVGVTFTGFSQTKTFGNETENSSRKFRVLQVMLYTFIIQYKFVCRFIQIIATFSDC